MTLKQWLRKSKMTQQRFAQRLGVKQGHVSQIVTRGTNSLRIALRITSITRNRVTLRDLLPPEDIQ